MSRRRSLSLDDAARLFLGSLAENLAAGFGPEFGAGFQRAVFTENDRRTRGRPRVARSPERPTDPREILGVPSAAPLEECEAVFRVRSKWEHPDVGGDPDAYARLSAALTVIRNDPR